MKLVDLMAALQKFDGIEDREIYLYTWDNVIKKPIISELKSIEESKIGLGGLFLLAEGWPECMAGGHDDGCLCNLGFTPRWR